jgi:hypothetical protein
MDSILTGHIQIGDLILISNSNYLTLAFYAGTGRGTLQYYSADTLSYMHEHYIEKNKSLPKRPWKSHLNSPHISRTTKYDINLVTNPDIIEKYQKAIIILKHYNVI